MTDRNPSSNIPQPPPGWPTDRRWFPALLRVGDLLVDPDVQRDANTASVSRMERDPEAFAVGSISVSLRADGSMYVMDGQNRVIFKRRTEGDDALIDALVYTGLSVQQEARIFVKSNNSTAVRAFDKFRVRLVEGDPVAVELAAILAKHGWRIPESGARGKGHFLAVVAIERIYHGADFRLKRTEPEAVEKTIATLTKAWGTNPDAVRSELVGGLGRVLIRYPDADIEKIARELASAGSPIQFVSSAKARVANQHQKLHNAVAELVVQAHNKGRRSNRLPAWEWSK